MHEKLTVTVQLLEAEAIALAELCKRIGWRDAMELSIDEAEARHMLQACNRVRTALAEQSVHVR